MWAVAFPRLLNGMRKRWGGEVGMEHTHPLQFILLACHSSLKHQQNPQKALSILEGRVGMLNYVHVSLIINYAFTV